MVEYMVCKVVVLDFDVLLDIGCGFGFIVV